MPTLPVLDKRDAAEAHLLSSTHMREAVRGATQSISMTATTIMKRLPNLGPRRNIEGRQSSSANGVIAIPTVYQGINTSPQPGTVVGIVVGSVGAFLLILWVLWILSNGGGFIRASEYEEEDVVVRRRSRSSHRHSERPEMVIRASSSRRPERIVRQERIVRDIPPSRGPSRIREEIIIDEPRRRVEGDDIVEVIEEHSSVSGAPPPRRKSRRSSGYR
ncbi:Hypothetical protein R9X50_00291700 [Acrodontium crateriforme]|uniref:Uncharacterized protein n=1 Tax=Acrodontium crateriforme TaxID=150365 RepID=A0AAQ3M1X9_9PEZI|nr:Hypothetical protein R9X50_00291700 [Acrodontium crateriforme]